MNVESSGFLLSLTFTHDTVLLEPSSAALISCTSKLLFRVGTLIFKCAMACNCLCSEIQKELEDVSNI